MTNLRLQLRSFRAACTFLTRLPVGGYPFTAEELRWSSAHFPLVGLLIGMAQAGFHVGLAGILGPWSSALMTVAFSVWVTGAFHEDGLADTADALGGGYTKAKVLEILKDSRVGTFGATALALSLIGRVSALAVAGPASSTALVVIESLSRAPPVVLLAVVPYATRPEVAKSKDVAEGQWPHAAQAVATAVLVLAATVLSGAISAPFAALLGVLAATVAAIAGRTFVRAVGGITGDFLGATQQLVALGLWLAWIRP